MHNKCIANFGCGCYNIEYHDKIFFGGVIYEKGIVGGFVAFI